MLLGQSSIHYETI